MKGVVFLGNQKLEIREFPKPEPGLGEVLIEMKASGLCGSDLLMYRLPAAQFPERTLNIIKGHEPCGVVVGLGTSTRNVNVGDRVMIHHYVGCGKCKYCLSGWSQLCVQGRKIQGSDIHGGHADFMVCPDTCCVPLPGELTFEEGALLSCGTGTAYHALKRLDVSGRDTLAIFGQGPVGMSATMLAKVMGAKVIAIDMVRERLESSKRFGADEIINATEVDPVAAIKQLTRGEGADATMDCTGNEQARVNALRSARIWGRACFVGERGTATFDISELFLRKQLTVYGSWTFSTHGLAEVANHVVQREVPIKNMITHRFPVTQAEEAYGLFAARKTGKAVFVWP